MIGWEVNNEQEIWEEVIMASFEFLCWHLLVIIAGLRSENWTRNVSQYEEVVLSTRQGLFDVTQEK